MTKVQFITSLREILQTDEEITEDTNLRQVEGYDSMAVLSIIAFFDETFQQTVDAERFENVNTVSDLMGLVGRQHFD